MSRKPCHLRKGVSCGNTFVKSEVLFFIFKVEHPCTEMVADINLPAAQLQVGCGNKKRRRSKDK